MIRVPAVFVISRLNYLKRLLFTHRLTAVSVKRGPQSASLVCGMHRDNDSFGEILPIESLPAVVSQKHWYSRSMGKEHLGQSG